MEIHIATVEALVVKYDFSHLRATAVPAGTAESAY